MSASEGSNPAQRPASVTHIPGSDSSGNKYASTDAMWKKELQGDLDNQESGWYGKAIKYWGNVSADIDGVLGGQTHVHAADIKESRAFLSALPGMGRERALDCGAGVGRISKELLCTMFKTTDLLEPLPHMLEKAKEDLKGLPTGEFYLTSMQKFTPEDNKYDLIVIQWAALYLTDDDLASFLARCKRALRPNGYIFFKENVSKVGFLVDHDDSSLTRSDAHYKQVFDAAGTTLVRSEFQKEWPKDLFTVKMYALQ